MNRIYRNARHVLLFIASAAIVFFASTAFAQEGLKNPLNSNFSSIPAFIAGALKALAMIALPIITLFLVISGFYFITAQGNQQKLETAKKNFFYVVIGALLILGAWIIATLIAGTVNQLTGK
ncbi:hypothetical protein A3C21_02040 [Candidatus Kaiserbacteria bacterium RIFCSPHIGHO2_02_FULL_59_21]|uniref:TrbC/VIRB2 family protein n=1 Tax=Candidatus Kaiserbacteria bacterium RIFCSPHIGHO2_02_FULL_59_21 TaxID=1798500 RepID=A0A1F6E0D3_9BACT|nr:MAG: hypothetical protein A3C21_02040 [Candidatus Kaiserbacteria bacterium RIFCSPHIGHO2_02_FULL_59_21]